MYVLTLWGKPLACAKREELLNEYMTEYPAMEQRFMAIFSDVPCLK